MSKSKIPQQVYFLNADEKYPTAIYGSHGRGKSVFLQKEADLLGASCNDLVENIGPSEERQTKMNVDPIDKTLIEITAKYKLERYLIDDAINELLWIGIEMAEHQMVAFLAETRIGTRILDYGEVETTIREDMMDALGEKLLGESWPTCGGLVNKDPSPSDSFTNRLMDAAIKQGYKVTP